MPPFWFEALAAVALGVSLLCSLYLIVAVVRHPQKMAVMNWVWPVTALYFGPVAIYAFQKLSRPAERPAEEHQSEHQSEREAVGSGARSGHDGSGQWRPTQRISDSAEESTTQHGGQHGSHEAPQRPFWQSVWLGVTHCGAGCTLGDIIAEWTIFAVGVTLLGTAFWPNIALDYALALLMGIAFQYFAIAPMRGISGWQGIWAATKADVLSLTAFEVGLFAWMALSAFILFPDLRPDNPAYWFMMQIGMVIGFGTSYPMNWWLIRHGIKEAM